MRHTRTSIDGGSGQDSLVLDLADRSADATLNFDPTRSNTIQNTKFNHIENLYLTTGGGNDTLTFNQKAIEHVSSTDGYWYGGGGDDTINVDFSTQAFNVAMSTSGITEGDFSFVLSSVEAFIYEAGSGNDGLYGGAEGDKLTGNAGNDSINGYGGNDKMYGGDGRDTMYGGIDNDTIDGGNDRDTLSGDDGKDKLTGGDGKDVLYGGNDNDNLKGGDGNDRLEGDDGKDKLDGRPATTRCGT